MEEDQEELMSKFIPWFSQIEVHVPTAADEHLTKKLREHLDEVAPLEGKEGQERRIRLLEDLRDMVNVWVLRKLEEKNVYFEGDRETECAGKVFISGSYRLGVNTPGTDIDSICIIPTPLTREEFFDEEDGMIALLRKRPEVSYVNPVIARVPIIEVVWDGIDLDVQCCVIQRARVPQKPSELLDDSILIGMDEKSQLCINGPRVTEVIVRMVPHLDSFVLLLRCIRLWFKRRGLYSNKMGFLGGVNFAILCAFVCQLCPEYPPSRLLCKFFELCRSWKWPTEIRLCQPYSPEGLDLKQWDTRGPGEVMPIITPAYPSMNSSFNVTKYNLGIMSKEFARAEQFCERILDRNEVSLIQNASDWAPLFEESDFFVKYPSYLVLKAKADEEVQLSRWSGWVEARLRRVFEDLDRFSMEEIYPFPKKFAHKGLEITLDGLKDPESEDEDEQEMEESKAENEENGEEENKEGGKETKGEDIKSEVEGKKEEEDKSSKTGKKKKENPLAVYWYIGLRPHPINSVRSGSNVDITSAIAMWCSIIKKWPEKEDGMDVSVALAKWKDLPDDPELFPNGKAAAKNEHKICMQNMKRDNAQTRRKGLGVNYVHQTGKIQKTAQETASSQTTSTLKSENADLDGQIKSESIENGLSAPVLKEEDSAQDERMKELLGKRAREEKEENDALSAANLIAASNPFDLPTVGGLNPTKPLKINRRMG